MLADGSGPRPPGRRRRSDMPTLARLRSEANPVVTSFDRLGRFVVRRACWVVGAWARPARGAVPLAPQVPGAAERRRLHPRRPRIGARQGAPRRPSSAPRRRPSSSSSPARRSRPARPRSSGRRRRHARHPDGAARRPGRVAPAGAAAGLGRPPHRLRHRLPRPAAGRLARGAADPARAPPRRAGARRSSWPAARPSTATSRPCREADLQRSEIISLPLAALALLFVFGSVVAAGVPLVVGGARGRRRPGRASSSSPRVMPMSIFVLNLATLLGLGLGVDYSLLMTSRFREELARAPGRPGSGRRGGPGRRSRPPVGPCSSAA